MTVRVRPVSALWSSWLPPLKDFLDTAGVKVVTTIALAVAALSLGIQATSMKGEVVSDVKADAAATYLRRDLYEADRKTLDEKLGRMGDGLTDVKGDLADVNQDVAKVSSELGELRAGNAAVREDLRRLEDLVRELSAKGH